MRLFLGLRSTSARPSASSSGGTYIPNGPRSPFLTPYPSRCHRPRASARRCCPRASSRHCCLVAIHLVFRGAARRRQDPWVLASTRAFDLGRCHDRLHLSCAGRVKRRTIHPVSAAEQQVPASGRRACRPPGRMRCPLEAHPVLVATEAVLPRAERDVGGHPMAGRAQRRRIHPGRCDVCRGRIAVHHRLEVEGIG